MSATPAPRTFSIKLPDKITFPLDARDLVYAAVMVVVALSMWLTSNAVPTSAAGLYALAQGCAVIAFRKLFPNLGKVLTEIDDAANLPEPTQLPDPAPVLTVAQPTSVATPVVTSEPVPAPQPVEATPAVAPTADAPPTATA